MPHNLVCAGTLECAVTWTVKKEKNILRGKLFVIIMLYTHTHMLCTMYPFAQWDNVWINATKHEIQRLNTQNHVQCYMKNCLKHATSSFI